MVPNPCFSLLDDEGGVLGWRSAAELERFDIGEIFGKGSYCLDPQIGRSRPSSLAVEKTSGAFALATACTPVTYAKSYKFSTWVRTAGASGEVRLCLYWLAFGEIFAGRKLPLRLTGKTVGERYLSGDNEWTLLNVEGRPPFGTSLAMMTVIVDNNASGKVWIDDACFDGYGSEPIEITCSHLGFHPEGNKRFLIKSMTQAEVRYQILNGGERSVRSGTAAYLGFKRFPDRHYYAVDVSDLRNTGAYKLTVNQGGDGPAAAHTFTVSPSVYVDLSKLLLRGIDNKKFNTENPGYYGPTHLDDYANWVVVHNRFDKQKKFLPETINTLGGFYDAGDKIKVWRYVPNMCFGAMSVYDLLRSEGRLAGKGRALCLSGLENMVRVQLPDGSFHGMNGHYACDSIPYYGIERFVDGRNCMPQVAGFFARCAEWLKAESPDRSDKFVKAAESVYESTRRSWESLADGRNKTLPSRLLIAPKQLFADIYLYRLTGRERYKQDMEVRIDELCRALEARAYLEPGYRAYLEAERGRPGVAVNLDFLWVPLFFLEECPDHHQCDRLKAGLRTFVNDIERLSAVEPWGQAMALTQEGRDPVRWPSDRPLSYWSMLAYCLARIGVLFEDVDIVRLGERQLQWNLGHNPFDMCMVSGIGERFLAGGDYVYEEPEFYESFRSSGKKLRYYAGNTPTLAFRQGGKGFGPIMVGIPRGFPPMFLQPDYALHPGPSEYWQPQSGNFCAAAAAVASAFEHFENVRGASK